jgi:hypothetical protein
MGLVSTHTITFTPLQSEPASPKPQHQPKRANKPRSLNHGTRRLASIRQVGECVPLFNRGFIVSWCSHLFGIWHSRICAKGASLILLTEPYIFIWNFALIHIQCDVANVIPRLFHLFETKTKEGIRIDPFPSMDFCFLVNAQN